MERHKISNYDELMEYLKTNGDIDRHVLDNIKDEVFKRVYHNDPWIIPEDQIVTGDLAQISRKRVKELIKEDMSVSITGTDITCNDGYKKSDDEAMNLNRAA